MFVRCRKVERLSQGGKSVTRWETCHRVESLSQDGKSVSRWGVCQEGSAEALWHRGENAQVLAQGGTKSRWKNLRAKFWPRSGPLFVH